MTSLIHITGRTVGMVGLLCCLGAAPLLSGLTGCASGTYRQADLLDDRTISTRVRTALDEDHLYKYDRVNVITYKGVVQLSGFASTNDQKDRAGSIAKNVEGARAVENKITVKE